jgi:hypothetical protein
MSGTGAGRPLPFELPVEGIADDNDVAAERPGGAPERAPGAARYSGPAEAADAAGCMALGPSAAGKTSLLFAVGRACLLPEPGDPDLLFVPDASTAELMKQAVRESVDERLRRRATRQPATYGFHVQSVEAGRRWPRRRPLVPPLRVAIHDGPGGALFPAEVRHPFSAEDLARWQARLFASARQAASLLFCVNAECPQSDLWQTHLPEIVSQIVRPVGRLQRKLQAERVLVLLTKVDRLCDRAVRAGRDEGTSVCSSLGGSDHRAETLARNIDPVEQARQALGVSTLNLIRSVLKPTARFAAGVTSAGGFSTSGRPYWDHDGKPVRFSGESGDDVLRRWMPFGVRDAIVFVASGRCRGTVREIRREDLLVDALKAPATICVRQGGG